MPNKILVLMYLNLTIKSIFDKSMIKNLNYINSPYKKAKKIRTSLKIIFFMNKINRPSQK
jgi:hypothetical protein